MVAVSGGLVFVVPLHPDDGARLLAFCQSHALDPDALFGLAVHRYLDRVAAGEEPSPTNGLKQWHPTITTRGY